MAIAGFLRGNTTATLKLGPFLDSTDGNTAETALTISQADVRLSKNGGDMAQKNESTSCTHDEIGYYDCPVNATDTNTYGRLRVMVAESGALAVVQDYVVLPEVVFDSFFPSAAGDPLPLWGVVDWGTAQASASGTFVHRSGLNLANDIINGAVELVYSGTGAGQMRQAYDFVNSTDTASISPNWTTTPDNTSKYVTFSAPPAPTNASALPSVRVAAMDNDVMTDAAAAADLATAIATAVWSAVTRTLSAGTNLNILTAADIRTAVGLASANLDTQIATLPTLTQINTSRYLKNTASQKIVFVLVDSTDHVTRKTGITVTAQRSLDGATFGSCTGSVTEVGNGVYYLSTSTADINADDIVYRFTGTACDPVEIHVVTAS